MQRILTGIQSTGIPHLGNLLGALIPAIGMSKKSQGSCFFLIADLHALTTQHTNKARAQLSYAVAASWLALGLDTKKHILYRQSNIPEVCELAWYLNCFTPYPMLANAHAFKDKSSQLAQVNAALFTYPVLQAADILLYDATHIPVGKDQQQHLEITRDIARIINQYYPNLFVVPQATVQEKVAIIPGTDGRKMSKSYGNTINIFLPERELKQAIMHIQTDSTPLETSKNPDTCPVFKLYSLLATQQAIAIMRKQYLAGGYGYGDAKKELFSCIINRFKNARKRYNHYLENIDQLEEILCAHEEKARTIARTKMKIIRQALGYSAEASTLYAR
ncbi:MAG: tryptophan--tRNA ligase [Bacteroidota bacterium]